jgi:hypothetical protein
LTDKWELTPGTTTTLSARIIGSLEGPKFVKPEISTVSVKIQTYIEKEFKAIEDKCTVFIRVIFCIFFYDI